MLNRILNWHKGIGKRKKELALLSLFCFIYSRKWVQTKVNVYKTTRFIQKITRNWRNWQVKWWQFLPNFCTHFGPIYGPVGQLGPNLTWFSERYVSQVSWGFLGAFSINIKWGTASQSQTCFWQFCWIFHTCFRPIYGPVGQVGPNLTWFSERYVSQVLVGFFWTFLMNIKWGTVSQSQACFWQFCQIFIHVSGQFTGLWAKLAQIWLDF